MITNFVIIITNNYKHNYKVQTYKALKNNNINKELRKLQTKNLIIILKTFFLRLL